MLPVVVALLAEFRRTHFQQLRVGRAMRLVTITAILQNRRMFPQEGSAPFGVATVTILVDGALDQLLGIGRAVWIVATGAGYLALSEGHMR